MVSNLKQIYEFGTFRLDRTERLLTQKGKPIPLTPKAFEVLAYLVERPGHLVEKDELMREVWAGSLVEEANLSRTVWMLRQALGDDRNGHRIIETVPKHGYRFVTDVRIIENDSPAPRTELPAPKSALEFRDDHGSSAGSYWRQHAWLISGLAVLFILVAGLSLASLVRRSGPLQNTESPVSEEAKDAYMRGLYSCSEARNGQTAEESKTRYLKGIESLERAVAIAPSWVDGQSELADCGIWRAAGDASYYSMAKSAAVSAINLDDSNAKAHHSLGFAHGGRTGTASGRRRSSIEQLKSMTVATWVIRDTRCSCPRMAATMKRSE